MTINIWRSRKTLLLKTRWHQKYTVDCQGCQREKQSFYNVKYGSSIISSNILSNKNIKTCVSIKIVCFGILIHVLSWRQHTLPQKCPWAILSRWCDSNSRKFTCKEEGKKLDHILLFYRLRYQGGCTGKVNFMSII